MELLTQSGGIVLLITAVVAFALLALLRRAAPPPYAKRKSLLTAAERRFHGVLRKAAEGWTIFAMVRIADLLEVASDAPQRQAWLNRILSKHIDFVLCDGETLEAVLAIELDDRSHERADRIARDQFVDRAFAAAQLPLLRVKVEPEYDEGALRKKIRKLTR